MTGQDTCARQDRRDGCGASYDVVVPCAGLDVRSGWTTATRRFAVLAARPA